MRTLGVIGMIASAALLAAFGTTSLSADGKCGVGKCGTEKPVKKCGASKCGDEKKDAGKCGKSKEDKKPMKCGVGKCGS